MARHKRLVKEPLPGVLAVAGASVHAFLKTQNDWRPFSFRTSAWIARRKGKLSFWRDAGRGLPACRAASILSKTAGARARTFVEVRKFDQRLNRMACIDG